MKTALAITANFALNVSGEVDSLKIIAAVEKALEGLQVEGGNIYNAVADIMIADEFEDE